jgi:hypothetical protein
MAVQIKELIIKAICGDKKGPTANTSPVKQKQEEGGGKLSFAQRKQLIDECTAEVMERLKRMNEF